jgi:hypothetical protein
VWFYSTRALHGEKDSGSTCGEVAFSATPSVSEALNEMGKGGARFQVIVLARDGSDQMGKIFKH